MLCTYKGVQRHLASSMIFWTGTKYSMTLDIISRSFNRSSFNVRFSNFVLQTELSVRSYHNFQHSLIWISLHCYNGDVGEILLSLFITNRHFPVASLLSLTVFHLH